ncbi:MAG TPA: histidine phosphatase family protein [Croceibacterium sp.]|nr:histidine phosphatase family protein [Croceibacterium sp.]
MKLLGLLRHAKSDWNDAGLSDFDRGLNARGRKGAALMGRHIMEHGVAWQRIVASPAERVKRTLETSGLDRDVVWDERIYLGTPATLLDVLRAVDGDPRSVLAAGHNPGLQELIFELVAPESEEALFDAAAEKFPTAAFAVLECRIDRWSDLGAGCARLVHLARPRDLDPELGPQRTR